MKKIVGISIFQFICLITGALVASVLSACGAQPYEYPGLAFFAVITVLALLFIAVIEIISVFKITDSSVHTVFNALSLLISYLCSRDGSILLPFLSGSP